MSVFIEILHEKILRDILQNNKNIRYKIERDI
jgi:hypothetical protein